MNRYDEREHERQIAERFKKETADHQMTVKHDDGLYRHLRFEAPRNSAYWFDIITWPGTLAVLGDIDGYMFSRVSDMFEFFRMHRTPREGRLEINPRYWSEKVEGRCDITKTYSEEIFRQHVLDYLKDTVKFGDAPRGLGKAIRTEVLESPDIAFEEGAHQVLRDFRYGDIHRAECFNCTAKSVAYDEPTLAASWERSHRRLHDGHLTHTFSLPAFTFADSWEWDLRDYDWSFLWACYAIVWGIGQYDAALRALASAGTKAGAS